MKTFLLFGNQEYNINNFKIDREHQQLFSIAREALSISNLKDEEQIEKLKKTITKLLIM